LRECCRPLVKRTSFDNDQMLARSEFGPHVGALCYLLLGALWRRPPNKNGKKLNGWRR
jgi:hypothetical protein